MNFSHEQYPFFIHCYIPHICLLSIYDVNVKFVFCGVMRMLRSLVYAFILYNAALAF